jgi:hypothetical protein
MQCFDDLLSEGHAVEEMDEWHRYVTLLRARPALHAHTLCYWTSPGAPIENAFHIARLVRPLWAELKPLVTPGG